MGRFDPEGLIWLRLDVDSAYFQTDARCWTSEQGEGWYDCCRETLRICQEKWPSIRRVWFLRHCCTPIPKDLFRTEEVGLHVTEPLLIEHEYKTVSDSVGSPLQLYTRHGYSPPPSGRLWSDEQANVWERNGRIRPLSMPDDLAHIRQVLPDMEDLTNRAHYTIGNLIGENNRRLSPDGLTYDHHAATKDTPLDDVLFHPQHLSTVSEEFIQVMNGVAKENLRRKSAKQP